MLKAAIQTINVNQLKVFQAVYAEKSMTLAAQTLFLTQSGVSQHIKKLETELGTPLFVRNRNELFSTPEADQLFKSCQFAFDKINQTIESMRINHSQELNGIVRIGVPTEFGNNVIIPLLSEWMIKNPKVRIDYIYGYGDYLIQLLDKGEIDLAFVDSVTKKSTLDLSQIYQEKLMLVSTLNYFKEKKGLSTGQAKLKLAALKEVDFIEYEHRESMVRLWFNYHFGKRNTPLKIRVWAMSVQGVANFIKSGVGAGVLPAHAVEKLQQEGVALHVYRGSKENLTNEISMVRIKNKPQTRTVLDCVQVLEKRLQKL